MEATDKQESHANEHESHHHGHGAHHHGHGSHHDEPMSPEEAVRSLLVLGQVALNAQDYESAVEAYASALKIEANETALYNLGSLYARGLGVGRNYVEGARLFHQAEVLGNERAGMLCRKCMLDYIHDGIDDKTSLDLYAAMGVFVTLVYPEAANPKREVNHGLLAVAGTDLNSGEYVEAAKVFRAAAEFGNDGYAQYYLAELYSVGAGLQQNDLAALYWYDCATDNGVVGEALQGRDGILAAYGQSLSDAEFREMLAMLADWCEHGTPDVPVNPAKAAYWREVV